MEQTPYNWMWTKRKRHDYVESMEEQAFAEDAAGYFGDYTWPPRSYSCSFCKREFKSAQALGGHMNVHRRDRARLKLSSNPPTQINLPSANNFLNPFASINSQQYSPQQVTLMYDQISGSDQGVAIPPASSVRVSLVPPKKKDDSESLNSIIFGSQVNESSISDVVPPTCKRRRIDSPSLTSLPKSSAELSANSMVLRLSPNCLEDLDLELRLGDSSKVK